VPVTFPERGYLRPENLAYSSRRPETNGEIRARPEDFRVDERLGFDLEDTGQHLWLRIRKTGYTTEQVAGLLARQAGVLRRAVSYAGMKDRQAVTRQWFSVDLAGRPSPEWSQQLPSDVVVEAQRFHRRKLRRGALASNQFEITISSIEGDVSEIQNRLSEVATRGVPNYFGPQRFGIDGRNVERAWKLIVEHKSERDRHRRSLMFSTARGLLFNRVLSARVELRSWDQALDGDVMQLDGSRSVFDVEHVDEILAERLRTFDVHATGPLWGRGRSRVRGLASELESQALTDCQDWREGLEHAGLEQSRRALRVPVRGLVWHWLDEQSLWLSFTLPPGAYATSVLREVINV